MMDPRYRMQMELLSRLTLLLISQHTSEFRQKWHKSRRLRKINEIIKKVEKG